MIYLNWSQDREWCRWIFIIYQKCLLCRSSKTNIKCFVWSTVNPVVQVCFTVRLCAFAALYFRKGNRKCYYPSHCVQKCSSAFCQRILHFIGYQPLTPSYGQFKMQALRYILCSSNHNGLYLGNIHTFVGLALLHVLLSCIYILSYSDLSIIEMWLFLAKVFKFTTEFWH